MPRAFSARRQNRLSFNGLFLAAVVLPSRSETSLRHAARDSAGGLDLCELSLPASLPAAASVKRAARFGSDRRASAVIESSRLNGGFVMGGPPAVRSRCST